MGDNKNYKILSVIALVLGVMGVTLGYAALDRNLTISPAASVTPTGLTFDVNFSSNATTLATEPVVPSLSETADGFTATNGTISNTGDPTITNLNATFTKPGQYVTYTFYANNASEYIAYLNTIAFSGTKTCTAIDSTTQGLVDSACNGIEMSVKVGNEAALTSSSGSITGHTLGVNGFETIIVRIEYKENSAIADGDFNVTLPSVALTYSTAD